LKAVVFVEKRKTIEKCECEMIFLNTSKILELRFIKKRKRKKDGELK